MMGLQSLLTIALLAMSALAVPAPAAAPASSGSTWWMSSIKRQGKPAFNTDTSFAVFRNVMDFGAKADGVTDDTDAINSAISSGNRCGQNCDSSTTVPAVVLFPPGVYLVSKPIIQFYYTQLIGDAINPPTLKAAAGFTGMAVIDTDPYTTDGTSWWVNQNNFFRQIRNFVIDLTAMPMSSGAGIHFQVAQASSLQNIVFNMIQDKSAGNKQQGIFMDNGSGGFMSDLIFNGGGYAAFLGNQQFTTRNLTFNGCKTAIFMNWNWAWALKDVTVNNCDVGVDMSNGGPTAQTVGSVLITDSTFSNVPVGVMTAYDPTSTFSNGTLIMDNVDMTKGVPVAVANQATGATILAGNQKIGSYIQGRTYNGDATGSTGDPGTAGNAVLQNRAYASGQAVQAMPAGDASVTKPAVLLTSDGRVFTRSKPQYEDVPVANFVSVKTAGAKGDGQTDDTAALQAVLDRATTDQVVFFDHGNYIISDTLKVPKNIRMVGEAWPVLMAGGAASKFTDMNNPRPMLQVGQAGDKGAVEMSDLLLSTQGPQPGAVLLEWNVAGTAPGAAGLWDVHFRVGGAAGTHMELDTCAKNPEAKNTVNAKCIGAFLMMHITTGGSAYLENMWAWVADHSLEPAAKSGQIDIYNGRGVLIEGAGPVWGYGTASEHSVMYQYQLNKASNVYLSLIQTETPYFQGNPDATEPFPVNESYGDPDFAKACAGAAAGCAKSWGLRVVASKDISIAGAGLYSFFDNYGQDCLSTENCQLHMVSLEQGAQVNFAGLSTKASVNMVTVSGQGVVPGNENDSNFCQTVAQALFTA